MDELHVDKKRKAIQNMHFSFNAVEGSKYKIICPENFIKRVDIETQEEKFFNEIDFDNSRIIEVLKVLGFNID